MFQASGGAAVDRQPAVFQSTADDAVDRQPEVFHVSAEDVVADHATATAKPKSFEELGISER
ncbi:MAG: hypothetical protein ACRD3W_26595, partial [Terriglobales bacterium]